MGTSCESDESEHMDPQRKQPTKVPKLLEMQNLSPLRPNGRAHVPVSEQTNRKCKPTNPAEPSKPAAEYEKRPRAQRRRKELPTGSIRPLQVAVGQLLNPVPKLSKSRAALPCQHADHPSEQQANQRFRGAAEGGQEEGSRTKESQTGKLEAA